MQKKKKKLIKLLLFLMLLSLISCTCLFRSVYVNPNSLKVRYKELKNTHISPDIQEFSILYFTDLEYGSFQNEKRTKKVFEQIYHLDPDVLIFGGDLWEKNYNPSDSEKKEMIQWLKNIQAPLGKFAVLGEQDRYSKERLRLIQSTYKKSEIEILNNSNHFISDGNGKGIHLIGLNSPPNWKKALSNISSKDFNMVVCHAPDLLIDKHLETSPISYALSGNSHGTQISFPIKGGYKKWDGAEQLDRKNGQNLSFPYYISTGIGCTNINARFNATPELVFFIVS